MPSIWPHSACRSRTTIPTIPLCSSATSSWEAVDSHPASPTASARKTGSPTARARASAPSPLDPRADLIINAIYNPTNVAKVVSDVDEELERLLRDGVTTAELDGAKNGYLQQQQNQRTNDMAITGALAENLFVGRTMQFQADLEQKIKDLTPEAVNTALRKYIDPKRFSVVTAGDFEKK